MSDTPRRPDAALALLSPQERARVAATGAREVSLLVFLLGDERYGVELHRTREILRARAPTKLPSVPAWLEGVVAVRGRVMPVVDVCKRLGLTPAPGRTEERFIVVHVSGNEPAALRVDAVAGVARFRQELVREARDVPFVRAIAEEAEVVRVLDVDALWKRDLHTSNE